MSWNLSTGTTDSTDIAGRGVEAPGNSDTQHPRKEAKAAPQARRAATFATFPRIASEARAGDWAGTSPD